MTSFTITVQNQQVQTALKALAARVQGMDPVLQTLGEGIIERSKHRFDTSTDPDDKPWKPNSAATLAMLSERLAGKSSYRKKNGELNAKGKLALTNKKPLIGDSGDLRRQIVQSVFENTLVVSSTPVYAAMQQFGGTTSSRSMIPGKTIPARPFLPVHLDGTLYPKEEADILQAINDYLMEDL